MFKKEDIAQIEQRGSSVQTVEEQVERFKKGFPWMKIVAPATPEKGIQVLDDVAAEAACKYYENAKINAIRRELGTQFCRRCNYCAPCREGISIPSVFLFEGYLSRYGLGNWAKDRYNAMAKHASDCVGCGACETRCPYNLPIRQMLKVAATKFGK